MKERLILFCMLLLCGIGVSRAQSGNAKDFDQKEEAIVQKLQQAVNEKNYKEAEKNGKALITLFKEQDENTQKKYSWLIQSYYYNLACFQSLLKKKGEAIKNLELAYDNGFQDYNHMMNDTDLDKMCIRDRCRICAKARNGCPPFWKVTVLRWTGNVT